MYVPLWLAVTIAYVVILAVCLWWATRWEDFLGCFAVFAVTIVYLLFWVAYLALTRG